MWSRAFLRFERNETALYSFFFKDIYILPIRPMCCCYRRRCCCRRRFSLISFSYSFNLSKITIHNCEMLSIYNLTGIFARQCLSKWARALLTQIANSIYWNEMVGWRAVFSISHIYIHTHTQCVVGLWIVLIFKMRNISLPIAVYFY